MQSELMLRKLGYSKEEILNMKSVEYKKIQFSRYVDSYSDWYGNKIQSVQDGDGSEE